MIYCQDKKMHLSMMFLIVHISFHVSSQLPNTGRKFCVNNIINHIPILSNSKFFSQLNSTSKLYIPSTYYKHLAYVLALDKLHQLVPIVFTENKRARLKMILLKSVSNIEFLTYSGSFWSKTLSQNRFLIQRGKDL